MGLFGGKHTEVASVVYNFAGPVEGRVDYLKSVVAGNVLLGSDFSMAETITRSYVNGPGTNLKRFHNWALANYGLIGVPYGDMGADYSNIDPDQIADAVPRAANDDAVLVAFRPGNPDFSWWADQYVLENYPTLSETNWTSKYNSPAGTITITFEDTTTTTFTPVGFDLNARYIYIVYRLRVWLSSDPMVVGDTWDGVLPGGEEGYVQQPDTVASNGSGGTITTSTWTDTVWGGMTSDDHIQQVKKWFHRYVERNSSGTIIGTTYDIDYQVSHFLNSLDKKIYIYKIGSGNTYLDSLASISEADLFFLPFIPVRIDNTFLSETYEPDGYALAKRAYKKATGGNYDELITKLSDNPDLDDIDYAYVVFGVPLNCVENTGKEYLYRFFENCFNIVPSDEAAYLLLQSAAVNYNDAASEYEEWYVQQSDPAAEQFGDPEPDFPKAVEEAPKFVQVTSTGTLNTNFDFLISWVHIQPREGTGLAKVGATVGEYWTVLNANPWGSYESERNSSFTIYWQESATTWKSIEVIGALHENRIYGSHAVTIGGREALEDADESGFLVPLQYELIKQMSLINFTQMHTSCTFGVFNCVKVVKQKWYQTGIFKIVVILVIVAITIATGGAGAGAVGILGANLAVGTALGLTGLVAVIVGAVANMVAAMVLTKLITMGATAAFGDKVGMIVAAIASMVALQVGTALQSGQGLAASWGNLLRVDNIIQMTSSVGNGVAGLVQGDALKWAQKSEDLLEDYNKESKDILQKWIETFGLGEFWFDPMQLTESDQIVFAETLDQFINRTLMTGGDIAEMSNDMLSNFASFTLSTDL